jgi:hypothetical protein
MTISTSIYGALHLILLSVKVELITYNFRNQNDAIFYEKKHLLISLMVPIFVLNHQALNVLTHEVEIGLNPIHHYLGIVLQQFQLPYFYWKDNLEMHLLYN